MNDERRAIFIDMILEMRERLEHGHPAKFSPEGMWILSQTKERMSKADVIIFIQQRVWDSGMGQDYAGDVALNNSIGPVRNSPLLSLVMHELNVGNLETVLPTDSHTVRTKVEDVREMVKTHGLQYALANWEHPQKHMDFIWAEDSSLALIDLSVTLAGIKLLNSLKLVAK